MFDLEPFGKVKNWSLRSGGRLQQVALTGGSTAVSLFFLLQFLQLTFLHLYTSTFIN